MTQSNVRHWRAVRALLIFMLCAAAWAAPGRVRASTPALTSTVTADGLSLRLTVPGRTYPRDALIQVKLSVRNVSNRTIGVEGNDVPQCYGGPGPGLEIRNTTGKVVYPPAAPWMMPSCGPPPTPISVAPGQVITDRPFVILRGRRLRSLVIVGMQFNSRKTLATPWIAMRLTKPDRPVHRLSTEGGPTLTIGPVALKPGMFYYVESGVCRPPAGDGGGSAKLSWQTAYPRTSGIYRFGFACPNGAEWSFVGGFVGHSVVKVTYRS